MGKYFKMADEFSLPVKEDTLEVYCRQHIGESFGSCEVYSAHAINSHDELVENVLHYEADALMWERRAVTEAYRAQELVAEVERLRGENEALMKCRMAAREFFNATVASGGSVKVSSASKSALDEADKASDWLEAELKATVDLVNK